MLQLHHGFHRRTWERLLDGELALRRQHGDHHSSPRGQRLSDPFGEAALESVVSERAGHRACGGPDRRGCQQRRGEQPHRQTCPGAPGRTPAAQPVARVD